MYHRNTKRMLSPVMLVGVLLVASVASLVQAHHDPAPPPPRREPSYETGRFPLPLLPGAQPQTRSSDLTNAAPACAPWTRLAFASYRNEQSWDVFVAKGDGTGQTRLTNRADPDTGPKLNRGCTRIAYYSYRGGQYEIYTMNVDGSNQTRLTNTAAYDGTPCWSPDSARIAFQSDRDGNDEVYVMNANGSGQTNLTHHPAYDGMPAWSPDGARIAFVSNRTGQYEVWVMNANGTGQKRVTTGVQWAQYPCWSPDGTQIAFSNDDDGDGFLDVDVVNADGTGFTHVAGHTDDVDYWYPAWSPDGEWIAYGRTELTYYQGNWYWTRSDIYAQGAPGYGHAPTTLVTSGHDWRPHWETRDTQAPTSWVQKLPAFSGIQDLISWSGQDAGLAGIGGYDVQYRDGDSGPWTDWLVNTSDAAARFTGVGGHVYYFRSRARDRAWNQGTYPSTGPYPYTTFYTYRLSGHVRDTRGTSVTDAVVDITPPPLYPAVTDPAGNYDVYLTGQDLHTVDVNKANYGTLPPMSIQAPEVLQPVTAYLPPADDQVQNGGFEASSSTLSGWSNQGTIPPTIADAIRHTGDHAARLGLPLPTSFTPELNISNSSGETGTPKLAVDRTGTVHVVWYDSTPGNGDIYYARRTIHGTWSTPQNISANAGASKEPSLAIDGDGAVHVAWQDATPGNQDIYYARRTTGGVWSSPQNISNDATASTLPQLATGGAGIVHLTWSDKPSGNPDVYYACRATDGSWSSPQNISNNAGTSSESRMAVDQDGAVHLAWCDYTSGNGDIYYTRRTNDGAWSSLRNISCDVGTSITPLLAVDESGVVHVLWNNHDSNDVYYARRASDGSWSNPLDIADGSLTDLAMDGHGILHAIWWHYTPVPGSASIYYAKRASDGAWSSPQGVPNSGNPSATAQLAVNDNGIVHVVWEESDNVYHSRRASTGSWSSPQQLSVASGNWILFPELAVDRNGLVHVVWRGEVSYVSSVYYVGPANADQTGDSGVAQALAVPTTMSAPTLSFVYQLGGASATHGTGFKVQVDDGSAVTTLLSTTSNTDVWTQHWFDLTPWVSQTITVIFNVHSESGTPRTWAYLDEVTLGSAYPNLWVQKTGGCTIPPGGGTVRYAIAYGNQGGVPAQGVHLTDTLPAGMAFVSASPAPTSTSPLVWDVGALTASAGPHTIAVTATVDASVPAWTILANTVTIGATTPEADLDNNTAVAQTFVGYRLYLPLVARDW